MSTGSLIREIQIIENNDKQCNRWARDIHENKESVTSVTVKAIEWVEREGGKYKLGRVLDMMEKVCRKAVMFYDQREMRETIEALISASKGHLEINRRRRTKLKPMCCVML